MKQPPQDRWRDTAWRRPLTEAEQMELCAALSDDPDARADWEAEVRLTAALNALPDAPVPSNFATRVLRAIDRERAAEETARGGFWRLPAGRRWLPRLTAATVALAAVGVSLHIQHAATRAKLGRSMAAMASLAAVPSPDALRDFEPIARLQTLPAADKELLSLLQ